MGTVRLTGRFNGVEVVAQAGLEAPEVEGPHRSHEEGETLVVEGTAEGGGSSSAIATGSEPGAHLTIRIGGVAPPVTVRVPRQTDVDADMPAGSISVSDVGGAVRVRLDAGIVRLERCSGAGSVRCRAGSVFVGLAPDAGVRVRARVGVGSVDLPDGGTELVTGDGATPLDVEVDVGSVKVSLA